MSKIMTPELYEAISTGLRKQAAFFKHIKDNKFFGKTYLDLTYEEKGIVEDEWKKQEGSVNE